MMVGKEDLGLSLSLGCSTTGTDRRGIDTNSNVNNPPTAAGSMNRIFQLTSSSSSSSSFCPFQLNIMKPSSSSAAPPTTLHSNPFAAVMHKTPTWNQDNNPFLHHFSAVDRTSDATRATTNTTGTVAEPRSFVRGIDVNRPPTSNNADEDDIGVSSPNSTISSISGKRCEREAATTPPPAVGASASAGSGDDERTCSRGGGSDDEDGDTSRKKLRLSKDQSAILEESFKEHNTLNPKQKLALAKRLGLRPRQVEVWFQNRRARTKLKQTEVDCEFLKRCCEQLTEENRRLQKEVQELRALKLSPQFYMQMTPPTTLTMCPSCERVGGGGGGGGGGVPPSQLPGSASTANSDARSGVGSQNHHHQQHHRAPAAAAPLALNPWGVRPFEALQPRS